ncbi:T9SS type A sorting domain-containing protein [Aquimarina sp. AU119]|uniref:T9SS type A sorting domain-containing protein n=1 Tax=Aquimarina sp. AU119 TaxID=2108528 RepID=UPI000D685F50|nr:T9SS type A sorting domain-containing protein [Aquimarina sp. AU119]
MNKSIIWGLLCLALTFTQPTFAQLTKTECDQKAETVLELKNSFKDYPAPFIDELISFITPCAESGYGRLSPASGYAKGLLHLKKGDHAIVFGSIRELSFLHLSRASYNQYPPAVLTHSINLLTRKYIGGHDVNTVSIANNLEPLLAQDYKKDIVHYILGYLSLKNLTSYEDFTNVSQINKAKAHFEASNHPMAKHWLAIMHHFGYGTPEDKTKALQILTDNDILNSTTLAQTLQSQNNEWIPISAEERLASLENYNSNNNDITVIKDGNTIFNGHLIIYDWTASGVKQYVPVKASITTKEDYGTHKDITLSLDIEDQRKVVNATLRKSTNHGSELVMNIGGGKFLIVPPLKNLLQDHPDKNTLTYKTNSLLFKQETINQKEALIVKMTTSSEIVEFKERIHTPIRFVLYPQETPITPIAAIAETDIKTSTPLELDKNFATIAPNPIGNQFNITYSLDKEAEVQISIYDLFGQQRLSLPSQNNSNSSLQSTTIDSSALPSGTYIVQMRINGQYFTKTVIKE